MQRIENSCLLFDRSSNAFGLPKLLAKTAAFARLEVLACVVGFAHKAHRYREYIPLVLARRLRKQTETSTRLMWQNSSSSYFLKW